MFLASRRRKSLSQLCPLQQVPRTSALRADRLTKAEKRFLERKKAELHFTNMHHQVVADREAVWTGEIDPSPAFHYPTIQAYRRFELGKRSSAAVERLWSLSRSHRYFRFVLNIKSYRCREFHARRLEDVRRYVWRRIGKLVTGYVRSLHLDQSRYPHWDCVLAVPQDKVDGPGGFNDSVRMLNDEIYGYDGPGDVRLWTKQILRIELHVRKSIDYSLRLPRFDRSLAHPWMVEGFRSDAVGLELGIRRRRIVRVREYVAAAPLNGPAEWRSKRGRPRKSEHSAYRQRRRSSLKASVDVAGSADQQQTALTGDIAYAAS
jgi:hypothetical protein